MSKIATRSATHPQQEQKKMRTFVQRIAGFIIVAIAATAFVVPIARAIGVDDKYSLISPSGIPYSDFRGYEDWAVVSTAKTDVLKAIVANPAMIKAYKAGTPSGGKLFPEGSKIVKIQWKTKKSTEAPFVVDVPDVLAQVFVMEKDTKRFAKNGGGWGYAVFNYDAASGKFSPDAKSLSDCGNTCHTAVKAKDYIFHPYQTR
jgi:Cytochrome P460